MQKKCIAVLLAVILLFGALSIGVSAKAEAKEVVLSESAASHTINPNMYGIFIEDINNAVEGGLNANLVRNNSFEYLYKDQDLSGWEFSGGYTRETEGGMNANNPSFITISGSDKLTVKNLGFCEYYDYKTYDVNEKSAKNPGMGISAGETYEFSVWLKNTHTTLNVYLVNKSGEKISDTNTFRVSVDENWQKFGSVLTAATTELGALVLEFESGPASLDFVTLYPCASHGYKSASWKYTTLRQDLYDALYNLHPAFVRFPGGCVAEGDSLENNYNWKNTIGPLEERKQTYNLWQNDVIDYNNSFSVGYHEYFQLCEDLGAEPVPILNVGLICQPRSGYDEQYAKYQMGELTEDEWQAYLDTIAYRPGTPEWDSYVQDVLDLIEYANGDTNTEWGAKRAENGHPAPFGLKYLGLGNENWGDVYFRNLQALKEAIEKVYPDITIITSAGPVSEGEQFDASWNILSEQYADTVVDEHYYQDDTWYLDNLNRYDDYDRNGPKVFLGEYAATSTGVGTIQTKSNLKAALSEAAYMTSLERNGDVVTMASYAPLLAKINAQEWTINLIWFNAHKAVLTPSYYTQMLFMNNTGSEYLEAALPDGSDGMYQSVTVDRQNELIYVKLVNTTGEAKTMEYSLDGFGTVNYADVLTLSDRSPLACNEENRTTIAPKTQKLSDGSLSFTADGYSVNVLRIAYGSNTTANGLYRLPQMPETGKYFTPVERVLMWAVPLAVVVVAGGVTFFVWLRKRKKADA